MDRIAVISDIHGNMPALETVFEDISKRNITEVICLGDLAGKGPESASVVDTVREKCSTVVKGNWDYFLTEKSHYIFDWHKEQLGTERLDYMRSLPLYNEFYMSGKLIRLCHASPTDLFHRTYIKTEYKERIKLFDPPKESDKRADIVGYGDIHGAHVDSFDGMTIFNTGSVGNPLDMTQASYAILEGEKHKKAPGLFSITIVRVPYDIELAISRAQKTDMPEKEEYIKELRTGIYRRQYKRK